MASDAAPMSGIVVVSNVPYLYYPDGDVNPQPTPVPQHLLPHRGTDHRRWWRTSRSNMQKSGLLKMYNLAVANAGTVISTDRAAGMRPILFHNVRWNSDTQSVEAEDSVESTEAAPVWVSLKPPAQIRFPNGTEHPSYVTMRDKMRTSRTPVLDVGAGWSVDTSRFEVQQYKAMIFGTDPVFYGEDAAGAWHPLPAAAMETSPDLFVPQASWNVFKQELVDSPGEPKKCFGARWSRHPYPEMAYPSKTHCMFYGVASYMYAQGDKIGAKIVAQDAPAFVFSTIATDSNGAFAALAHKVQKTKWTMRRASGSYDTETDPEYKDALTWLKDPHRIGAWVLVAVNSNHVVVVDTKVHCPACLCSSI